MGSAERVILLGCVHRTRVALADRLLGLPPDSLASHVLLVLLGLLSLLGVLGLLGLLSLEPANNSISADVFGHFLFDTPEKLAGDQPIEANAPHKPNFLLELLLNLVLEGTHGTGLPFEHIEDAVGVRLPERHVFEDVVAVHAFAQRHSGNSPVVLGQDLVHLCPVLDQLLEVADILRLLQVV